MTLKVIGRWEFNTAIAVSGVHLARRIREIRQPGLPTRCAFVLDRSAGVVEALAHQAEAGLGRSQVLSSLG